MIGPVDAAPLPPALPLRALAPWLAAAAFAAVLAAVRRARTGTGRSEKRLPPGSKGTAPCCVEAAAMLTGGTIEDASTSRAPEALLRGATSSAMEEVESCGAIDAARQMMVA